MSQFSRTIAAVALASAGPLCHAGALKWDQTQIEVVAKPEEAQVSADFPFHNAGSSPVTIVDISTSCPCTSASAQKSTYAPGESGQIHAVFEVKRQRGRIEKVITVTTDDAESRPTELILDVTVQQYVSVEPRLVYWRTGGDDSVQTLLCTAQTDKRITLVGVTCSPPDVVSTIDVLNTGQSYAVRLRSPPRAEHATVQIELKINIAGVGPRVVDAYAYYR